MTQVSTKREAFLQRLSRGPILADGAMGTELYARGRQKFEQCLDELNLLAPDLVLQVHLDYLQAGAEILETNTFGANRLRLEPHGLAERVGEINRRGVELAREARRLTGAPAWIAGAIGPAGKPLAPLGPLTRAQAGRTFREQVDALLEGGIDMIVFETFSSLGELEEAVRAAQEACDLPIVAQMTFTEEGNSLYGDAPTEAARRLREIGVDVVGANCSVGSQSMVATIEQMALATGGLMAAQPNAGFPHDVEGRHVYMASPEYMVGHARRMVELGVSIIGGCCGTTPEHTAALREAVAAPVKTAPRRPAQVAPAAETERRAAATAVPDLEPTGLAKKLGRKFVVTMEVIPPKGFDVSQILERLRPLQGTGLLDAVNIADNPRARGRMSALATSALVQGRLGLETIMHLATRHRNLLALHSELLGAHGLGVRNLFIVRGDPPSLGDYPEAGVLSDVTPSGLMRLIEGFNRGEGALGQSLERPTSFITGAALDLAALDMDRELRLLERKVEAGADFLLTQPIYDPETVERWRRRLGGFPKPVLLGVLPLRSLRHAEFLHNEVPGIAASEAVRERLRRAGEDEGEVGLEIAREVLRATAPHVAGAYVIPPFNRYQVLSELLEGMEDALPGLGQP